MGKYSNTVTQLVSKWFDSEIDLIVNESGITETNELLSTLSERIQNLVNEQLQYISEGFVSELIHKELDNVNFHQLIVYHKN